MIFGSLVPQQPWWLRIQSFIYRRFYRVLWRFIANYIYGRSELERILSRQPKHLCQMTRDVEVIIEECDAFIHGKWVKDEEAELASKTINQCCGAQIGSSKHSHLFRHMLRVMSQIRGYWELFQEVERRRQEIYDARNPKHEKRLSTLWTLLIPDQVIDRKSSLWQQIGFQGDDPATDFRGMGVLALDQLLFYAKYDVANAQSTLRLSLHPTFGFPMALVGITLTAMQRDLLLDGYLKNHFYNKIGGAPSINHYNHVYCKLFELFTSFWERERPDSVMEFAEVRKKFERSLKSYLIQDQINIDTLLAEML